MAEASFASASLLCAFVGMGWLALAMKPHWTEVRGSVPHTRRVARRLRFCGGTCLALSLGGCLAADHASMAILVWIMTLSASAVSVAMALALAPRSLAWLAAVAPAPRAPVSPPDA